MIAVTRYVLPLLTVTFFACGDEATSGPRSGSETLTKDTGIDFTTGALKKPGTFANSDLFATNNGDHLRLSTGGDKPTELRPIVLFRNAGLVPRTFERLADVPTDAPTGFDGVPAARTGYGFVLESIDGDLIRGWIKEGTATSVTIEWDRLP